MAKVTCIDVSCWQTNVDYAKVKKAGIEAVIIRAGYGRELSQKDSQFETHYKNAKANGLKIGAYWYSYANSVADAKKEAQTCLACIKGKSFDMPIYFDMEESSQTKLGKTTLTAMAKAFCEAIKAGGYRAGVYSNLNWFRNYLDYNALKKLYSIWFAQYHTINELSCDIWQNSSTGKISGVSGNCDTNVIYNNAVFGSSTSSTPTSNKSEVAIVKVNMQKIYKDNKSNRSGQVQTLQRILNELKNGKGYRGKDDKKLTVDGDFGTNTEYALRAYQKAHKLTVDGICGKNSWSALLCEVPE